MNYGLHYSILSITFNLKIQDKDSRFVFVTYTIIQWIYNQQWNLSQVRSMESASIMEYIMDYKVSGVNGEQVC